MNKWIDERWTNKGIIRNGTKQTFHSLWCPVSHTWPKHVGLLCSSLSQVKNTVGLGPAPTIFLPHTPERGFSVCGCASLALWFCLMSSVLHRSAPLFLFSRKDSRNPPVHHRESWCYQQVLALSWQETKMMPCVSAFQKDWRTVTERPGYSGGTGLNFPARTLRPGFYDGENFHVRLWSVSIPARYFCSILTKGSPAFLIWYWHTVQWDETVSR